MDSKHFCLTISFQFFILLSQFFIEVMVDMLDLPKVLLFIHTCSRCNAETDMDFFSFILVILAIVCFPVILDRTAV
jgi:hypothetical protein